MNILISLIVSTLAIIITSYILPGVHIDGALTALIVAVVLALLNIFVKPVLIFLTIPITFFTFGLFLLVINVIIILLCTKFVPGFTVDGFWWALAFSLILTFVTDILSHINDKFSTRS